MKIGNNGNLVLGPFDESTPCLMIVLMNCQTKLRINHLTAVKSVAISERCPEDSADSEPHPPDLFHDLTFLSFRHHFHLLLFQVFAMLETTCAPELGFGSHHPLADVDCYFSSCSGWKQHTILQRHKLAVQDGGVREDVRCPVQHQLDVCGGNAPSQSNHHQHLPEGRSLQALLSHRMGHPIGTDSELVFHYEFSTERRMLGRHQLRKKVTTNSGFQRDGAFAHTSYRAMDRIYTLFTPDRVVSRCQSGLGPSWGHQVTRSVRVNLIFLVNIVRILVTKMKTSSTFEIIQVRRAMKATALLFPLLGITHLLFCVNPRDDSKLEEAYMITNATLQSSQGIFVSILYCFMNIEVQTVVRKAYVRAALRRNPNHRYTWKCRTTRASQTSTYVSNCDTSISDPSLSGARAVYVMKDMRKLDKGLFKYTGRRYWIQHLTRLVEYGVQMFWALASSHQ
ncbi:corticotropin-releasing factor receptor 1 [Trichonephila clavipes]|nr:corticotropin-releasing factor receptor 1 [Trichonephila clavipes]